MKAGRAGICAIAVMAKAPRIGEAKTRLSPPLSAAQAAQLSASFLEDIAHNLLAAARSAPIEGYVACSPAGSEALFLALLPPGIDLVPSRRAGLGHSLFDAAEDLLGQGYGSVCLVNADSPTLPTAVLTAAAMALAREGDRIVLGPAADGGYYLIGLKQPHRRLFADIAWSTERVFRQTIDRAAELGLEAVTLPVWYDVDDMASLRLLAAEVLGGRPPRWGDGDAAAPGYAAPMSTAVLRRLLAEDGALGRELGTAASGARNAP